MVNSEKKALWEVQYLSKEHLDGFNNYKKLERLTGSDEDIPDDSPFVTAKGIISGQTQSVIVIKGETSGMSSSNRPLISVDMCFLWLLLYVKKLERLTRLDEDVPDVLPFITARGVISHRLCDCPLMMALAGVSSSNRYNAIDTNPLSVYVMHPFWNRVVQLCPTWVAPNLLTFVGFLITIGTFLILSYYDVDFYASSRDHPESPPIPKWVFLVAAFNVFLAYTLDGIDGKQARRTGTSGPLGELFDHGLDSWSTMFITTALYSVFGRSEHSISTVRLYFVLWNIFINFYLSHWEKYNTGVLYLPWGYDVSMVITVTVFLITGIFGYEIWKFDLSYNINAGHVAEFFFYISALVVNVPVILYNICKSYQLKTGKMLSFAEAVRPLVPVLICFTVGTIWALGSPTDIVGRCPRCVYFMTGTLFSNICCRLIVSQMSNTRCDIFNWLLLPLSLTTLVSLSLAPSAKATETTLLYLLMLLVTIAHFHYGACVVRQMCGHFHIDCFRIRKKED